MSKETIKSIIFTIAMIAICFGVTDFPETAPTIEVLNRIYSFVLMLFLYVVMKDI